MDKPTLTTVTPSAIRYTTAGSRWARLLIGCGLMLLLTCGAYARSAKWEYRVVSAGLNNRQLEALLNSHGAEGWELVQITTKNVAIFRRQR